MDSDKPIAKKPEPRGGDSRRGRSRAVISIVAGLLLWEVLARTVLTNRLILVPLSTVLEALWAMARTGELWKHAYVSLIEFVLGFGLAAAAGVFFGFVTRTRGPIPGDLEPL